MEMNPTCAILWDVENIHPKETEIIIQKIEETNVESEDDDELTNRFV